MNQEKIKVLFFGTPDFALPSYQALIKSPRIDVIGVVSQSSKPKGRGSKVQDPPIVTAAKNLCQQNVVQPFKISSIVNNHGTLFSAHTGDNDQLELCKILNEQKPDFNIVVAYGKIIPDSLLEFPRYGSLNLHPSALPLWRGAAPLQHTIFSGADYTEICIMRLVKELDAGPVYLRKRLGGVRKDTLGTLHDRTANIGAELLVETILSIVDNNLSPIPQDTQNLSFASKWNKTDCKINWFEASETILNRIRACSPKPGAFTFLNDSSLKIYSAKKLEITPNPSHKPGQILMLNDSEFAVVCGDEQILVIEELQLAGRNKIKSVDFLNQGGYRERLRSGESIFFSSN